MKRPASIALLTVSDTRTWQTDKSGAYLEQQILQAGHRLAERAILADELEQIVEKLREWIENSAVEVVIISGGTGLTRRDVTPQALDRVGQIDIPGFGELFRWLSYQKIGSSTIQSRACAVLANGTYIFSLPGSTGACQDAWEGILKNQLDSEHAPCNFIELLPRL